MKQLLLVLSFIIASQTGKGISVEELDRRLSEFESSVSELAKSTLHVGPSKTAATHSGSLEGLVISDNSLAIVAETIGKVSRYDESTDSFLPVSRGFAIEQTTILVVSPNASLVLSLPGRIAALVSENSRIVIDPPQNGSFELGLRSGTVSVLTEPEYEDSIRTPSLTVSTPSGSTRSSDDGFFAVTQNRGQTYLMTKRGKVEKKSTLLDNPHFSPRPNRRINGFSPSN